VAEKEIREWGGGRVSVLNATFNNILIKYRGSQFYWWRQPEYPEKTKV
jgi:hypothetical protein